MHHRQNSSAGDITLRILNGILLTLSCVMVLYPVLYVLGSSFSDPMAVMKNEVTLLPVGFTTIGYKAVFADSEIWTCYLNTIFYTVAGTAISIFATSTGAYVVSRKDFAPRNTLMIFVAFTMFFSGGMIPTYLLIANLHMMDTIWAMILPGAISAYNFIIMRTFFQNSIPFELQEAAIIDGCNDVQIFAKIVMPLSAPIIAVMVLFYGVANWNAYFNALIYLSSRNLYPLQLKLREILIQNESSEAVTGPASDQQILGMNVKYALIVVSTVPILCVYPFLQRYFVKGIMIGAIKG